MSASFGVVRPELASCCWNIESARCGCRTDPQMGWAWQVDDFISIRYTVHVSILVVNMVNICLVNRIEYIRYASTEFDDIWAITTL